MIRELFPRTHDRYLSLPLLGPLADDLAQWLRDEGYERPTRRQFLRAVVPIDRALRRRGLNRINALAWRDVVACWNWYRRRNARVAGTVHVLQRFLTHRGLLGPPASKRPTRTGARLAAYATYLRDVRGLDPATIHQHVVTAEEFLRHLKYETDPTRLAALSARESGGLRPPGRRPAPARHAATRRGPHPWAPALPGVGGRRAPGAGHADRYPARVSSGAPAPDIALGHGPRVSSVHRPHHADRPARLHDVLSGRDLWPPGLRDRRPSPSTTSIGGPASSGSPRGSMARRCSCP